MFSARTLLMMFDSAYVVALAAWVGAMLFFTAGVAPIIFRVLDEGAAARFVRALFPRYYAWNAACGAVALASFVCGVLSYPEFRGKRALAQIVGVLFGLLCMLHGGNVLTPAINRARDAGPAGTERFRRLHRTSVVLNGIVMLVGLALLVAFATRPAPRTVGLREATPQERLKAELESQQRTLESVRATPRPAPPTW